MPSNSPNPKVSAVVARKATSWHAEIEALQVVVRAHNLTEELKWGNPCYPYEGSNVLLIRGVKTYCAVLFMKGALLKDESGLLVQQTENVQSARQIRFSSLGEIRQLEPRLNSIIAEAITIEQSGAKARFESAAEFKVPEEFQIRLEASRALKLALRSIVKMKFVFVLAVLLSVLITPAFAWEVFLDQENAFGDKNVLVSDSSPEQAVLGVQCMVHSNKDYSNLDKRLYVEYSVLPSSDSLDSFRRDSSNQADDGLRMGSSDDSIVDDFPIDEEKIKGELFIKLDKADALILPVTSGGYLEYAGLEFSTAYNSDGTKKAVQLMLNTKGKIFIGVRLPDGRKLTSNFGTSNISLIQKAIDACK